MTLPLEFFKSVGQSNTVLRGLDGRVKTAFFLTGCVVSAVVRHWYLAAALWLAAVILFATLGLPWRFLLRRLAIPFGVAWLVLLSLLFTAGGPPLWVVSHRPFFLAVYGDGLKLGVLMLLRIMASVTMVGTLSFSTPMVEILESLRVLKIPGIMIDLADMMFRYVFIISDVAGQMRHAQMSRTTRRLGWTEKIRLAGQVAGYVISQSLDRSVKIFHAMVSRGFDEKNTAVLYFTGPVSTSELRIGLLLMTLPAAALILNYVI